MSCLLAAALFIDNSGIWYVAVQCLYWLLIWMQCAPAQIHSWDDIFPAYLWSPAYISDLYLHYEVKYVYFLFMLWSPPSYLWFILWGHHYISDLNAMIACKSWSVLRGDNSQLLIVCATDICWGQRFLQIQQSNWLTWDSYVTRRSSWKVALNT